jgi:hypothetical protein
MLDTIDVSALDTEDSLAYVSAVRRQQAWTDARLMQATARFAETREVVESRGIPGEEKLVPFGGDGSPLCGTQAPDDLGPDLRLSRHSAQRLIADSLDLMYRLTGVWMALRIGLIDTWRARMVAEATRELSAETAAAVEDEILGRINRLTRGQLRKTIDRIVARDVPETPQQAAETTAQGRRVDIDPTTDDHAEIYGLLGIADSQRLDARLDEIARLLAKVEPGSDESHDQRRARALGLLADPAAVADLERRAAGAEGDPKALPNTTFYLHLRPDQTADLERYGVLAFPTVSELVTASNVTVKPVIDLAHLEPSSGYQPSDSLREGVLLANATCVFPYCDYDARRCQLDHTIPYPRGQTEADNLGPMCLPHHLVKTHGRWRLQQPFRGIFVWLSPTGRVFVVDGRGTYVLAA